MNKRDDMDLRIAIDEAIRGRRAVRCFLDTPLEKEVVAGILDVARAAPSNSNTQPWRTYVVAGEIKRALSAELADAHSHRAAEYTASYKHFPDTLEQQFSCRRDAFAAGYYDCLGIDRADQAARDAQTGRNYLFFGAPVGFIFTIDSKLERGSWLDYGMFLQSVMIAAQARGIGTCPQISFAKYHSIIRSHLHIPDYETVICGMSMGYADMDAPVNSFRLAREGVESFASFLGFDGR